MFPQIHKYIFGLPVFEPPPVVVESDALGHPSHDVDHILLVYRHLRAACNKTLLAREFHGVGAAQPNICEEEMVLLKE